ncbi:ankyrin repeat domain-containing protein 53-like isoform X2 [Watersipora subatra]|uniref:ankyrin repeat domain-containing protein 53-like isoform X2 n=1 Tax=Watersipora subatra TaxID=2589382 RepID=UPI00355C46A2
MKRGLDTHCTERRTMRNGVTVTSHEELTLHMKSESHMTCVHAAAQLGCLGCLKWMIEHIGLPSNEADQKYGATPLHYAANSGHPKIIRYLLHRITKVHTDYDGATPLHDAAMHGHLACVQELLKSSLVNPEQVDNYGLTAREWAEQAQERKCAKIIRESIMKKVASLPKGKKATLKREKQALPPSLTGQYSDSADSHSNSPTSETYAQLELPADCFCGSSSQLPPKLPDTPRPFVLDGVAHKHRTISGRISKDRLKTPDSEDLTRLPPPPASMLQSLFVANTDQCIPVPPPPPQVPRYMNSGIRQANETVLGISKPMSAVLPYKHSASSPTTVSIVTSRTSSQVPCITTPPAPQHSFSTFSVNPPRHSPKSPPEFNNTEAIQQIEEATYKNSLQAIPAFQHSAIANPSYNLVNSEDRHLHQNFPNTGYKNVTADDSCTEVSCVHHTENHIGGARSADGQTMPDWKKQLQLQIAKKQEKQQGTETSTAVPDWKKLVQERKQESMKKERGDNLQSEETQGLAPWQSELKKAGRILGVEILETE